MFSGGRWRVHISKPGSTEDLSGTQKIELADQIPGEIPALVNRFKESSRSSFDGSNFSVGIATSIEAKNGIRIFTVDSNKKIHFHPL